ncbi:MAG TPA: ABC transporter permease [Burkholderiaceae bacterium]|nr:ABC transporter permease [Burkholderiaceae bacterium]
MQAQHTTPSADALEVAPRWWGFSWLRRLAATPVGAAGLLLVGTFALLAVLAPVLPLHDPLQLHMNHRLAAPGGEFLLGTDQAGRDILSRIIWGGRTSLAIGACVIAIGLGLGVSIGLVAGYYSRTWLEEVLMKLMEVLASIPLLIWAIAMVGVLGVQPTVIGPFALSNEVKLTLLIGILYVPGLARLTHGLVLQEAAAEYVLARRIQGASPAAIVISDILPNVISPVLVQASILMGVAIIVEASLSFIGLGVQPPTPSWGTLLADARNLVFSGEWWVAVYPGLTVFLAVLGLNLLGDGLRVVLDPRRGAPVARELL